MVVITGKGGGNLRPVGLHLRVDDRIHRRPTVALQAAVVPVIVDHDIHSRSDGRVNRLFDLLHIGRIDVVVGDASADVGGDAGHVPRTRNTRGIEPVLDGRVEQRRLWRPPVQLQAISDVHPVGRNWPWRGGGNIGNRRRLQTNIEHRVKAVAATGDDWAAGDGDGYDFTASVGVRGHGQRRIAATGRLPAKGA